MTHSLLIYAPFTDRAGKISPIKLVAFVACCAPAALIALEASAAGLGLRSIGDIGHYVLRQTGDWSIRFLVATLAITPLRYVSRFNGLQLIRRMVGLTALFYTLAHVGIWVARAGSVSQAIKLGGAIGAPFFAGCIALVVLALLGITSNDAAIKRLGSARWNKLQSWVHIALFASLLHMFMHVRQEPTHPALMVGLSLLFVGFRLWRSRVKDLELGSLALLAIAAFGATAAIEAGHHALTTGESARRLLGTLFSLGTPVRAAWWVLCVGLTMALARDVAWQAERGRSGSAPHSGSANARS